MSTKVYFHILSFLLTINIANGQFASTETGAEKSLLKGKVKSISMSPEAAKSLDYRCTYFKFNTNGYLLEQHVIGDRIKKIVNTYDVKDRLITKLVYRADGSIYTLTNKYNLNGNLVESYEDKGAHSKREINHYNEEGKKIRTDFVINNEPESYNRFKYDSVGNVIQVRTYKSDTLVTTESWKYNDSNKITEHIKGSLKETFQYDGNNLMREDTWLSDNHSYFVYEYDDYNRKIQERYYSSDRVLRSKIDFEYNNENICIKKSTTNYTDDSSITETSEINYNDTGKELQSKRTNSRGLFASTYRYNNDKLADYEFRINGKVASTRKYDSAGKEIERNEYSIKESSTIPVSTERYNYDQTGNIIKQTTLKKGKLDSIAEFKIEYY